MKEGYFCELVSGNWLLIFFSIICIYFYFIVYNPLAKKGEPANRVLRLVIIDYKKLITGFQIYTLADKFAFHDSAER